MALNVDAKSLRTLYASSCLAKYTLQVNLGSSPPFPSGTSSSQCFAIWKRAYLSISLSSMKSPRPISLSVRMS